MPEKGFTATFISNTGKTLRQFRITGWKLYLTRFLLGLAIMLVLGGGVVIAYGMLNARELQDLREEVVLLEDSLARRRHLESRLEIVEQELQLLRTYRRKLENIATMIRIPEDSLEQ